MPELISIQVGAPRSYRTGETRWRSAIDKVAVEGPVELQVENLAGDRQADLRYHGGPDKAVCCFAAEHYPRWRAEIGADQLPFGSFGENFTLAGLTEPAVCIGDVFTVGQARVEVSQPRQPCVKLARRLESPDLPQRLIDAGHTGFYLRVLSPGTVAAGPMILESRPFPELTVSALNDAMYRDIGNRKLAGRLASVECLSEAWRSVFRKRAAARAESN